MIKDLVTVVIPSRNEPYLNQTIADLLIKSRGQIEINVVLDGYWPKDVDILQEPRVIYIHRTEPRGMRAGINSAVAVSRGEYIMKTDAHCMFAEGWDLKLKADCPDNTVVVPRRYRLDPELWSIIVDHRPPIDYMHLGADLRGAESRDLNLRNDLKMIEIDDLMSFQGSCWFMKKDYFDFLELMDEESYGSFFNEAQEIGLKAWLSGGRVIVNKKTWYAHWHKEDGRGYSLNKGEQEQALKFTAKWKERGWHKQTLPLEWLQEKFENKWKQS